MCYMDASQVLTERYVPRIQEEGLLAPVPIELVRKR